MKKRKKTKKLNRGTSKSQPFKENMPKFTEINPPFIESTVGSGLQNLVGNSLAAVNEFSKSLSLAMPNQELLRNYNDALNKHRSFFEQVNTLNEKVKLEVSSVKDFASNVLAPTSAAIADVGLITAEVNQLSGLGKINEPILFSAQELSGLCLDAIWVQEEFTLSRLKATKNLEDFNKIVTESAKPLRMITNGVSEIVRSFSAFPQTLDLPSLEIVRDSGFMPEDELINLQEKVDNFLQDIDPQLVECRKGCWGVFYAKGPDYIGQASSSMRRLVDKLLRIIASDEEVIKTDYFRASAGAKMDKEQPSRKARLYYATDYEGKRTKHLKRMVEGFLKAYDNLPAWDHEPIRNDDFVHGIFVVIEGHLLSLLSELRKNN